MVARVGPPATANREPRQARKGATVTVTPGAGMWLARAASNLGGQAVSGSVKPDSAPGLAEPDRFQS